jgi:hypothetical protein
MQQPVLVLRPQRPAAYTLTTKIVVKVNGKKLLARPKNPLEVSLEARNFNNLVVISLKKGKRKVLLVKLLNGFKERPIVCAEGYLNPPFKFNELTFVV